MQEIIIRVDNVCKRFVSKNTILTGDELLHKFENACYKRMKVLGRGGG